MPRAQGCAGAASFRLARCLAQGCAGAVPFSLAQCLTQGCGEIGDRSKSHDLLFSADYADYADIV